MTSSFKNADQENVPAAPAAETAGAQPSTDTRVSAPQNTEVVSDGFFSNDSVEGDFDRNDIKMPRLSLVQGVGPLSGELGFIPGTFVYNKEIVVGDVAKNPQGAVIGTDNLEITLVHLRKYLLEDIPYGTQDVIPAYFKTMDDARRAGFHPVADKRQIGPDNRFVKPVLEADVIIKGRAGEHVSFPFEYEGTPFAIARWTLQSTGYNRVGKGFYTDSQLALKNCGLSGKFYIVSARKEKLGANYVMVPKAQLKGLNTPAFVAWAKNTASPQQRAA